jgi:hypothetical protein
MNLDNSIKSYLEQTPTKYAIQINGAWGKGKTYYWHNNIVSTIKALNLKPIYFSLNGISDINNLKYEFYTSFIPYLSKDETNKLKRIVGNSIKLTSNTLTALSSYFLKTKPKDIFFGINLNFVNFSNYVVCFDDYERCNISQKELLGFINSNVEHNKLKTIIFSNEIEILDLKTFKAQREKLIGRVFEYSPDISEVLDSIIENYKDKNEIYEILKKNKDYIKLLLDENKIENLRTVIFIIDCLNHIFNEIEDSDKTENVEKEIILFTFLISAEFKNGNLVSNDYKDFKELDIIDRNFQIRYSLFMKEVNKELGLNEEKEDENEKTKINYNVAFCTKYLEKHISNYLFFKSIYPFILSGYIDKELLNQEVKKLIEKKSITVPEKDLAYEKICNYRFREMEQDEFEKRFNIVYENAKQGNYSIYHFHTMNKFFMFFVEKNLIDKNKDVLTNELVEGVKLAATKNTLVDNYFFDGIKHFEKIEGKVSVQVETEHNKLQKKKYEQSFEGFIEGIGEPIELMVEQFKKHDASNLMQNIDINKLKDKVINSSNSVIFNFTQLFSDKYKAINIAEYRAGDKKNIDAFSKSLEDYVNNTESLQSLKIFHINILIKNLKDISAKLSTHSSKP